MKLAALFACALARTALASGCRGGDDTDARVWERFDATLDLPVAVDNPFDPAQADLTAEFVSPSGQTSRVAGFVTRDYKQELVDGAEKLSPDGDLRWAVRFTPTEAGTWRWRWSLRTPDGAQAGDWQDLRVGPARADRHGFLRRSPDDAGYLRFDDGAPYVAIGENLSWYDQRGTFAYDAWFARLAEQGVNYVRLWMADWAFGLEWTEPNTLGDYEQRLDRAWQLDYVLQQAERHGIYVMLSLQNHGAFSLTYNSEWDGNPYGAANGGPLAEPRGIFTDSEAKELFKRRLRYVVARWGSSPNVLAWELWNEVDLVDGADAAGVVAWHEEMARELRALDPHDHLISTSLSLPWPVAVLAQRDLATVDAPFFALWELPEIDFAQVHLYSVNKAPLDWSDALPRIAANQRRFGKPVLIAEAGVDFRGPSETIAADPDGAGFHDILWSGLFAGTFGTGMSWWWDNVVDPQDWYFHFGPVAKLVDGLSLGGDGPRVAASAPGVEVRALSLSAKAHSAHGGLSDTALVWVKNTAHQWYAPDTSQVEGATLTIQNACCGGTWHAMWIDTYTGEIVKKTDVPAQGDAPLRLDIPAFSRDIALRLENEPPRA